MEAGRFWERTGSRAGYGLRYPALPREAERFATRSGGHGIRSLFFRRVRVFPYPRVFLCPAIAALTEISRPAKLDANDKRAANSPA
jgi:hypothetical protein